MFIEDYIETPENVILRRKLAGIGLRFQAGLIDTLILCVIYLFLFLVIFSGAHFLLGGTTLDSLAVAMLIVLSFIIYWGYFLLFELFRNGQTPGKKRMKIRVVRQEGQGLTWQSVFIRNILRVVDGIGVYSVAGISMFASSKVQRLGDIAAGTVVISEQLSDYAAANDKKRPLFLDEKTVAAAFNETSLTPGEHRLLYNYWHRKDQLDPAAKTRILPKILMPILDRRGETVEFQLISSMENKIEQLLSPGHESAADLPGDKTVNESDYPYPPESL